MKKENETEGRDKREQRRGFEYGKIIENNRKQEKGTVRKTRDGERRQDAEDKGKKERK